MVTFVAVIIILLLITLFIQIVFNMKIIGGNELGIISGISGKKGFRTISGNPQGDLMKTAASLIIVYISENRPFPAFYPLNRPTTALYS